MIYAFCAGVLLAVGGIFAHADWWVDAGISISISAVLLWYAKRPH